MRRKKKNKTKTAPPVKSQKGLEKQYQRELNKLGTALIVAVNESILPFLKTTQPEYVVDGIGDTIGAIFRRLNAQFSGTAVFGFAKATATQMVTRVGANNKRRFNKTVEKVTGVDLGGMVRAEGLEDFMSLSVSKNVSLIKSLPEEYLKQVETIVNNGVINGEKYSSIAKKINARVGSANIKLANRIKTIAMNEVQTVNSQISLRRADNLGIKKGVYMTSGDERVRTCHAELDGKEYDLNKGAWSKTCQKFIQPGVTDINCRCSFSPVISIN